MDRDIIERLRDSQPPGTAGGLLLNDAADEIYRLREALIEIGSGNRTAYECATWAALALRRPKSECGREWVAGEWCRECYAECEFDTE